MQMNDQCPMSWKEFHAMPQQHLPEQQQQQQQPSYAHPFYKYDQECKSKRSDQNGSSGNPIKKEDNSPSPPVQFHSRHELALAEKCVRKLVVDSNFFPPRAAETDWFRNSHSIAAKELMMVDNYEPTTTVTALYEHELQVGKLLGTGGFCQVRVVRLHNEEEPSDLQQEEQDEKNMQHQNSKYAIKYLCPSIKQQKSGKAFSRGAADLAIEARFLSLLSHENIITLHHVSAGSLREVYNCSDDDGFNGNNDRSLRNYGYFLILDYLTGSLDRRIEKTYIPQATKYLGEHPNKHHDNHRCDTRHHQGSNKQQHHSNLQGPHWWNLSPWHREQSFKPQDSNMLALRQNLAQRLTILKSIASALQYLHENKIIMRDVKPNNIGFYNQGQHEVPKLFDFGLVKEMKECNRTSYVHDSPVTKIVSGLHDYPVYKLTGRTGSRRYMCPEVAFSRPYNEKADVYSFGILLYEVSTLLQPFQGWTLDTHEEQVLKRHHRPCLVGYDYWPDELFSLIQDCWQGVMWHRPDMIEVFRRLDACINELDASSASRDQKVHASTIDETESSSNNDPKCCGRPSPKNKHKFKQYLSTAAAVFPVIPPLKHEPAFHSTSTGSKITQQAQ